MFIIDPLQLESRDGKTRASAAIHSGGRSSTLWFEVDDAYAHFIADDRLDAFLIVCLLPAMVAGEDIEVRGTLSPQLYYNLTHSLIPIMQVYLGAPRRINVVAQALKPMDAPAGKGVMTGFSGGVDSFCNYYDHSGDRAPEGWHITHFVYNNVGSHGQRSTAEDEQTFKSRFALLKQFTEVAGIEMISVNSNMDSIIGLSFQQTHTLRNASVACLLQKQFCRFFYASGMDYTHTRVAQLKDTTFLDPIILPLLGTERLDCIASGGQHTRVDKTRLVTEIPASRELLDVCVRPENNRTPGKINCSSCWKCMRTATTLKAMGKLEEYHKVFSLELIRQYECVYLLDVFSSREPLQRELANLLRQSGYVVPGRVALLLRCLPDMVSRRAAAWLWPRMVGRPRFAALVNKLLGCSA